MMKFFWRDLVAFDGEGGAGGGGGQQPSGQQPSGQQPSGQQPSGQQPKNLAEAAAQIAANQQPNGQQPNGQQQQPNGQTAQPYLPDGLPEALRGASDRETIDKLIGDINGRPKAPATPKDYKYEFSEDFTKKFGDLKDDPVLPMWSSIAHKMGLSNQQAQDVVPMLFDELSKAGLIEEPLDAIAEMKKLAPDERDPVRMQAKAAARINAVGATLKGLETRKILDKTDTARLGVMMLNAANITAFEKVLKLLPAEHGLQKGDEATDGRSDYQKRLDALYPSMKKSN